MPSPPRVLLLCHETMQPFTGGGATLRALFSAFPPDALFSIHNDGHERESNLVAAAHAVSGDDVHSPPPLALARALGRAVARRRRPAASTDRAAASAPEHAAVSVASGVR